MSPPRDDSLVWHEVDWPRPLPLELAVGLLRRLAADDRTGRICWELRGAKGAVRFLVGARPEYARELGQLIRALVPGSGVLPLVDHRLVPQVAARLQLRGQALQLATNQLNETISATLNAVAAARAEDEETTIQVVLGPTVLPSFAPAASKDPTQSTVGQLLGGNRPAGTDVRASMKAKRGQYGFRASIRLGARAGTEPRRRTLILGLLAGLKTTEASGVRLRLARDVGDDLDVARLQSWWPLTLNLDELIALLAWPIGPDERPGLPPAHPKSLRPLVPMPEHTRTFAVTTAPGPSLPIGISSADALYHSLFLGPTGSGKSNALLQLIVHDMEARRTVVVIDPKADLVADVLARVPSHRRADVVVLDPTHASPVGLNPLAGTTRANQELVADGILAIFKALFASSWGPRTSDVFHASLLTLACHGHASLLWLPLLLTDRTFRRKLTRRLNDPIGLEPFWAQYEAMSPQLQAQVIGPAMSRLRQLLMREGLRSVLGQVEPKFALNDIFSKRRILLVPLNKGLLGPEAARLLGALLVGQLWQLTLARASLNPSKRHQASIYIDEMQDYLHLPTDFADALSQSRSLGVAWHLAHQYRDQLSDQVRAAVDANARNKVVFGLGVADATAMARMAPTLEAADFMALPRFHIYAAPMSAGQSVGWVSGQTLPPPPETSDPREVLAESAAKYGHALNANDLRLHLGADDEAAQEPIGRRARSEI